jgi:hypothetical protein
MSSRSLATRLASERAVELSAAEVAELLARSRVVREVDTGIAGALRILEVDDTVLVQEHTTDGRPVVRRVDDADAANRFVDDRLAAYDRMWDGCGCTVDPFD